MQSSSYLLQQMERCLRLARTCSDSIVAEKLRQMAKEFQDQADRLGSAHLAADGGPASGPSHRH